VIMASFLKPLALPDSGMDVPETVLPPEQCQTMAEVRSGVDAVDAALVALLARRFGYMDAAARIKQHRGAVRDEARKAQVLAHVRAEAVRLGVPENVVAALWEQLVEASIVHEFVQFDRLKQPA
jgi:isochorismate pyruvate lyase